jgi:hypothetical protein
MTTITEEWKVIETGSNYEISNYGQIRNNITMNILKSSPMGGYLANSLYINNKKVILKIHRLVAKKFLVPADETLFVNHKDGNKMNNCVENLEWVSRSENAKHAFRLGLNKGKKLKVSQYTLDSVFIKEYDSPADAENETHIYQTHISSVCRGVRKTAGGYIWKYSAGYTLIEPIPEGKSMTGYSNYILTKVGKVYNLKRKRYLISSKNCTGYMGLGLIGEDNKRTNFTPLRIENAQSASPSSLITAHGVGVLNEQRCNIHRLVALLFIDNPHNHPEVNHIDFDKTNNSIENLEWVSRSENSKHNFINR